MSYELQKWCIDAINSVIGSYTSHMLGKATF